MDMPRAALALMVLSIPALACSRPPHSDEALSSGHGRAQEPSRDIAAEDRPAQDDDAMEEYVSMRSPTVFDADIWVSIQDSARWPLVDTEARLAPELCRAPVPLRRDPDQGALSQSEDEATHGRKLYRVRVKDPAAYAAMKPGDEAPIGQTLIKDAWSATRTDAADPHDGALWAQVGAQRYVATAPTSLFIMQKLDPATEGTDRGWVYAVTTPDRRDIASAGVIEACAGCHARAPHDRLFGVGGGP